MEYSYEAYGGEYEQGMLPLLLDTVGASVLLIGRDDGKVRYINNQVCRFTGRPAHEIMHRTYRQVFSPSFAAAYERLIHDCENGDEHTTIYYWAEKAIWEQIVVKLVWVENTAAILLTITSIQEITLTQYIADNIVYFDALLNLPNGMKLEEDLNELASVETVALLYITVDSLKLINDLYGWHNGDSLLMQIRDWLLFSEPRRAQLYRLEDGFAILGRGVTLEDSKERADAVARRFEQPWTLQVGGRNMSVFCATKMGIVHGKYIRNGMRNLLLRTIEAGQDGDKYVIYNEALDRKSKQTLKIRDSLIGCIYSSMKGFELHYQPIVDASTGRWCAVEALCRWTMADGTKVPPDVFIHVAEKLGLIGMLDAWVRKRALQQCVALGLHEKDFMLSVNFSPVQKLDEAYVNALREVLHATGFPAQKLVLEVTESVRMPFDEECLLGLKMVTEQGVVLSLDDFGTGYSSLENLIKISSCSTLKVDKLFLDGVEEDFYKQCLLQMLSELVRKLDMIMILEGVETEKQASLLRSYGVDYMQGYFFSKPLPYQQLAEQVTRFDQAL